MYTHRMVIDRVYQSCIYGLYWSMWIVCWVGGAGYTRTEWAIHMAYNYTLLHLLAVIKPVNTCVSKACH